MAKTHNSREGCNFNIISTTPKPNFFLIIFKLIQQSNMVISSCLAKKNRHLNSSKKKSVYYRQKYPQTSLFSNKVNFFFLMFKFQFFFATQLRMTIFDCCISLKMIKKILVVLGVVDLRQLHVWMILSS